MPQFQAAHFPIGGRDAYWGYIWMYVSIAMFGACSALISGVPAITETTIPIFSLFFPIFVFIFAAGALVGVVYSRYSSHVRFEYWMTLLLLAGLIGYAAAIINRSFWEADADLGRFPSMFLPISMSVFPFIRLRKILTEVPRKPNAADSLYMRIHNKLIEPRRKDTGDDADYPGSAQ